MKRKFFTYSLFLLLGMSLGYGFFQIALWRLSDGFSVKNIQSDLSFSTTWQVPPLSKQDYKKVEEILSHPFHYLGKGSQCYVFESEDEKYVIKFFKHQRYRLPALANKLPLPPFLSEIQGKKMMEKKQKQNHLFQSCKIAYEKLQEESGLLYLHLNKTAHLNKSVILYDKLNRPYVIDIDNFEFIIQKKATLIYPYLSSLIEKGEMDKLYEAFLGIKNLLMTRFEKGVSDRDPVISKNAGFLDERPIYLDIGQFFENKSIKCPTVYQAEILQVTRGLRNWLNEKSPELSKKFDESLICFKST